MEANDFGNFKVNVDKSPVDVWKRNGYSCQKKIQFLCATKFIWWKNEENPDNDPYIVYQHTRTPNTVVQKSNGLKLFIYTMHLNVNLMIQIAQFQAHFKRHGKNVKCHIPLASYRFGCKKFLVPMCIILKWKLRWNGFCAIICHYSLH